LRISQEALQPRNQRYTIAYPDGYPAGEAVPLILALHYAGPGTPYFGRAILENLVQPALGELGAVILAPDCTAQSWSDPRGEAEALMLLDSIIHGQNIDKEKILVTGYSLGGNGAWQLAAHHPDRFSAAVVLSGWPPENLDTKDWQVPLYVIHSRDDEFIPIGPTENAINNLAEQGAQTKLVILDGVTHFETYRFVKPLSSVIPWIEGIWGE
jgi:predicted peptidase